MSAKTDKKLRKKAGGLPVVMELEWAWVKGKVLIEQGTTLDANNKELDPEKLYKALQPKQVDHISKIKHNYAKFGMKAVDEYCNYIRGVALKDVPVSSYIFPDWFDMDNVHEVGNNYIHYTEDADKPVRDFEVLALAINNYLGGSSSYKVSQKIVDDAVDVRLYILK